MRACLHGSTERTPADRVTPLLCLKHTIYMFIAGGVSDHNKNKGIIYYVSYSSLDNGWSACGCVYYSMESKIFYVTSHIFNFQSSGKLSRA